MTAAGPWTVASQIPGGSADVKRMIVGRVAQRDFVMANGFRDAVQRVVQFHRLRVPPVYDIPETRCRHPAPYRWRYSAHATDERLQRRPNLFVTDIDGHSDPAHEVEVGAERVATCRSAHMFPSCPRPRTFP